MKLSARNQIAGTIKTVKPGATTPRDDRGVADGDHHRVDHQRSRRRPCPEARHEGYRGDQGIRRDGRRLISVGRICQTDQVPTASAASNDVAPAERSGMKRLPSCRHSSLTAWAASWLMQSTGNSTEVGAAGQAGQQVGWFSIPPS